MQKTIKFYVLFIISNFFSYIISSGILIWIYSASIENYSLSDLSRLLVGKNGIFLLIFSIILFLFLSFYIQRKWLNKIKITDKFYSNAIRIIFLIILYVHIGSMPKLITAVFKSKIAVSTIRFSEIKSVISDYIIKNNKLPDNNYLSKYNDLFKVKSGWQINYAAKKEDIEKYYENNIKQKISSDTDYILYITLNKNYLLYDSRIEKPFWLIKDNNANYQIKNENIYIDAYDCFN